MKLKNIVVVFVAFLFFTTTFAQEPNFKKSTSKDKAWFIPDYAKIQYAGNLGLLSVGVGYQLFNNVLYSEILYGYVPESVSKANDIHLISIKNTFPIFTKELGEYALSPIAGFTASYETGNNSFLKLPDKYPKGYYVPSAIHFTLFVGALVHKDFKNSKIIKGADFYYEIGTVETFLWSATISREIGLRDVLSSAIGINFYF